MKPDPFLPQISSSSFIYITYKESPSHISFAPVDYFCNSSVFLLHSWHHLTAQEQFLCPERLQQTLNWISFLRTCLLILEYSPPSISKIIFSPFNYVIIQLKNFRDSYYIIENLVSSPCI